MGPRGEEIFVYKKDSGYGISIPQNTNQHPSARRSTGDNEISWTGVFWDVATDRRFRGAHCSCHQGERQQASLKRRSISTALHGATTHKAFTFIISAVRTQNLTRLKKSRSPCSGGSYFRAVSVNEASVSLHMEGQVVGPREGPLTQMALKRFLSCVFPVVTCQLVRACELPRAPLPRALVRFLSCKKKITRIV